MNNITKKIKINFVGWDGKIKGQMNIGDLLKNADGTPWKGGK